MPTSGVTLHPPRACPATPVGDPATGTDTSALVEPPASVAVSRNTTVVLGGRLSADTTRDWDERGVPATPGRERRSVSSGGDTTDQAVDRAADTPCCAYAEVTVARSVSLSARLKSPAAIPTIDMTGSLAPSRTLSHTLEVAFRPPLVTVT